MIKWKSIHDDPPKYEDGKEFLVFDDDVYQLANMVKCTDISGYERIVWIGAAGDFELRLLQGVTHWTDLNEP